MKNAKLLIPAVAVLALSSAAAVTGTVAWFTASKSASLTANAITIVNTEGNLKVQNLADQQIGATVKVGDSNAITVTHSQFRDGSVNYTNGHVFSAYLTEDGKTTLGGDQTTATYKDHTEAYKDDVQANSLDVYRANRYALKFTMPANTVGDDTYGLFLDTSVGIDNSALVLKAFRMAIVCSGNDTTQKIVWAPSQGAGNAVTTSTTYVSSTTVTATVDTNDVAVPSTKVTTYTAGQENHGNLLGEFSKALNETGITATIYTWLEGTDENCTTTNAGLLTETFNLTCAFNVVKKTA